LTLRRKLRSLAHVRALRLVGWCLLALAWGWAALALVLFPGWPVVARLGAGVAWLAGSAWAWRCLRPRAGVAALVGGIVFVRLVWMFNMPSDQRDWAPGLEHTVRVERDGEVITLHHVRHARYRTTDDFDVGWETRRYDLRDIRTVDFLVEPFGEWRGLAHTLLTFGFADGRHVAISVETRRERGETYSPLRGMFRHYELIYVVGDERDLIGLRANIRRDPVHLYPIRTTPEQARALFVDMLQRAEGLAVRPEFYHSIFSTCTTNLRRHADRLRPGGVRPHWRTVFPGYSDELALDLGLVDFAGTIDEARRRFLINERSAFLPEGADDAEGRAWSRQIRGR
jgi:hypothetical protein